MIVTERPAALPAQIQQRRVDVAMVWQAFHEAVCLARPMSVLAQDEPHQETDLGEL